VNLPVDWYASTVTPKSSLVYDFNLGFTGTVVAGDVKYVRVYFPGTKATWWDFDITKDLNLTTGWVATHEFYSGKGFELPIGDLTAEMALNSGQVVSFPFTMGVPGSRSATSTYVFNQDDESVAAYPSVSSPAIRRATVSSMSANSSSVVVGFTIHGLHVNNGFIWFFDAGGAFVGGSPYFRDENTGTPASFMGGNAFSNGDGQSNTVTLSAANIMLNGVSISTPLSSIAHCRVVVSGGSQYASQTSGAYTNCDYRAISTLYP